MKDKVLTSLCGSLLPNEDPIVVESGSLSLGAAVNLPGDLNRMSVGGSSVGGLENAVDDNSTEPVQSQVSAIFK